MRLQQQIYKGLTSLENLTDSVVKSQEINGVSFENIQSIARSVERLQGQRELEERYDAGNRLQFALNSLESMSENLAVSEDVNAHAFVKMGLESLGRSIGMDLDPEHLQRQTQIVRHALNKVEEQNLSFESKFGFEELQDELGWVGPVSQVADIDGDVEAVADESEALIQDATAFEALIEKVDEVNANGGFTPQSLKALNFALETFSLRYGQPDVEVRVTEGVSEAVNGLVRPQVDAAALADSFEDFQDSFRAIIEKIKEIAKKIWAHIQAFYDRLRFKSDSEKLAKLAEAARANEDKAAEIDKKIAEKQLKVSDILSKRQLTTILRYGDAGVNIFTLARGVDKNIHSLFSPGMSRGDAMKSLKAFLHSGHENPIFQVSQFVGMEVKVPYPQRTDEADIDFIKRVREEFTVVHHESKGHPDDIDSAMNSTLAEGIAPWSTHSGRIECIESARQVLATANSFIDFAKSEKPLFDRISPNLIDEIEKGDRDFFIQYFQLINLIDRKARVVLQGLMAGVKQYASVVVSTMSKIEHLSNAEATPATESLNASLEADIKQLKSGTKVKFSHGHGKITKVCTGPFMLAGKHHHASKDEPRFIVRADKGGHLSVHKASALKLV